MYPTHTVLDPVVICPYDKHHLIAKSRLQRHIVRCEKNYPEGYKVSCPYNATHRIFPMELEEHILKCPMRATTMPDIYREPKQHGMINFILQSEISSTIDCNETWDEDEYTDTKSTTTDDCSVIKMDAAHKRNLDISLPTKNIEKLVVRPPRGYSEAMLKDVSDKPFMEDTESVVSSMGLGRGKASKQKMLVQLAGIGRGKPLNNNL